MQPNQNKSHDYSDLEEILITGRLRKTYEAFGVVFELQTLLKSEEKLIASISDSRKQSYFYMYHAMQYALRSIDLFELSAIDRRHIRASLQPIVLEILYFHYYDLNMQYFNACELFSDYQLSEMAQYRFKVASNIGLELPAAEFRDIHWAWYYYHQIRQEKQQRWDSQDNSLYIVAATSNELAKILRKEFVSERQAFDSQFKQIYGKSPTATNKSFDLSENLRTHETENAITAHRFSSEFDKMLSEELQGERLQMTKSEYEQLRNMGVSVENVTIVDSPIIQPEQYAEELQNFPTEWVEEYQEE